MFEQAYPRRKCYSKTRYLIDIEYQKILKTRLIVNSQRCAFLQCVQAFLANKN